MQEKVLLPEGPKPERSTRIYGTPPPPPVEMHKLNVAMGLIFMRLI